MLEGRNFWELVEKRVARTPDDVMTVDETSSSPVQFSPTAKAALGAPSTPVEPGSVQVEEDVTVTFSIR